MQAVHNPNTLKIRFGTKIANKLKYQPGKPEINAWKLRKMIKGKMKEVPDIKTWIKNYDALMECKDELVKIILDGVPLETLFPGSYSGTFEKEKRWSHALLI